MALRELAASHGNLSVRRAEVTDLDSAVARQHLSGVEALPVVWIFDDKGRLLTKLEATSVENVERQVRSALRRTPLSE